MDKNINTEKMTVASEYEAMKQARQTYLDKAKKAAKYTIPSLITDDTQKNDNVKKVETPNQSVGADGVNNLAARVALVMMPPNQTFFKYSIDEMALKQEAANNGENFEVLRADVNKGLSRIEKELLAYQERLGDRVCLGEALKHLYIAGNVLLIHTLKDGLKYYPLDRFCVKRDYCGNVLKAITEETVGFSILPEKVQELIKPKILEKRNIEDGSNTKKFDEEELTLYTIFRRKNKYWEVYQEIEGIEIPYGKGKYPLAACPFMALRYTRIDGESYGRGLIEEYIGDISYLDTLSLAIKQASLAGSKLIGLVNPHGLTNVKTLSETGNGGWCPGRQEDIAILQANKYYDLQTAQTEADKIERRLNRIFVMKAAIQRDAERVTAEEIRTMVQDLEEALGNHYSIMCKEFQQAYVCITFFHLKKERGKDLPDLINDKNVHLTVTTGLEALGRGSELNKLMTFLDIMVKIAPAIQALGGKVEKIANDVATSLNMDTDGMFYSEKEKQQMAEEQRKQALLEKTAPNAVNAMGKMITNQQQENEVQNNGV